MTTYDEVMADIRAGRARGNGARNVKPHTFQSEHVLQIAVAEYLDRVLPPDAWWTSIDSAGRGAIQGARMKRRGVKRGLLDTLIIWQGITLWIELKSAKGRLTPEQREFIRVVNDAGHEWSCCSSLHSVQLALEHCRIPLRARLT